jgi:hypothetical protein
MLSIHGAMMKYEELQAIADAIISSNAKMIYLNSITILLAILSVFFVSLFKKSGELAAIHVAFEDIKNQNRVITSETESIKRQLEKVTIEYQIKLSKYHDKKISAIERIYSKLADLLIHSRNIMSSTNENKFDEFNHIVEGFRSCFEAEKIWLDAPISREIERFAIEIDTQVRNYQGAINATQLVTNLQGWHIEHLYNKHEEFYNFTASKSTLLKNQLEELLRDYLSPGEMA